MKTENIIRELLENLGIALLSDAESEFTSGGFKILGHDTSSFPLWGTKGFLGTAITGVLLAGYIYTELKEPAIRNHIASELVPHGTEAIANGSEAFKKEYELTERDGWDLPAAHPNDSTLKLLPDKAIVLDGGCLGYFYGTGAGYKVMLALKPKKF